MMGKCIAILILFTSASFAQEYCPWGEVDTVTSGDFDDCNPVLDHGGMQLRGLKFQPESQWLIFDRHDTSGSSVVMKRFLSYGRRWDTTEFVIASGLPPSTLHFPDVATSTDSSALAVWQQEDNGHRNIFYSRWNSMAWSQPEKLTSDTFDNVTPRVRILESSKTPFGSPFVVAWKRGHSIQYAIFYHDSNSEPDTLVCSDFDSLEFDLCQAGSDLCVIWTTLGADSLTRLCFSSASSYRSLVFSAPDTLQFGGGVSNPHIVTSIGPMMYFDSKVNGRWRFFSAGYSFSDSAWTGVQQHVYDDSETDFRNAQGWSWPIIVDSWDNRRLSPKTIAEPPGNFLVENISRSDTSLLFTALNFSDTVNSAGYDRSAL